ncbi:MAG: succinate dehydrogenase cytochrome b558 subunit [Bacillaceae bacterium]
MNGKEYTLRKWHSLLGVVPVGLFLLLHLFLNNFATDGAEAFNKAAGFMHDLPFRILLEVVGIYIPILYHAIFGLYIAFTSSNNLNHYGYFRNWMFIFQRISGVYLVVFIAWHVWETRIAAAMGATVDFGMMANILSNPWMLTFYIVGVVCASFHFANGLWSFFITWGITITPKSQKFSTYVTMILFLGLSFVFVRALFAFI